MPLTNSPMAPRFASVPIQSQHWAVAKFKQVVLKSANKGDSNLAREIHHHRQFVHPHIARLYEVIVTENMVWMVLEYCSGSHSRMHSAMSRTNTPRRRTLQPSPRARSPSRRESSKDLHSTCRRCQLRPQPIMRPSRSEIGKHSFRQTRKCQTCRLWLYERI